MAGLTVLAPWLPFDPLQEAVKQWCVHLPFVALRTVHQRTQMWRELDGIGAEVCVVAADQHVAATEVHQPVVLVVNARPLARPWSGGVVIDAVAPSAGTASAFGIRYAVLPRFGCPAVILFQRDRFVDPHRVNEVAAEAGRSGSGTHDPVAHARGAADRRFADREGAQTVVRIRRCPVVHPHDVRVEPRGPW